MYLSDVSVFTLLTLLFFSLLFLPICWGRVSHQSWTSRMLTVCVPATEHCFVSSASNKPKRDLVDSPPASPTTPVGLSDTQQFLQHFFFHMFQRLVVQKQSSHLTVAMWLMSYQMSHVFHVKIEISFFTYIGQTFLCILSKNVLAKC